MDSVRSVQTAWELDGAESLAPPAPAGEWTAILLAGHRPGGDPLADAFGLSTKALVPVAGMTMVRRVASTLIAVPEIGRVVILAQNPKALAAAEGGGWARHPRITFARSGPGIAASLAATAGAGIAPWPVLVTTADHVLLTPAMVGEFLSAAGEGDIMVGVGERRRVEASYPQTRRTWLKFSDGHYSGANLFALRTANSAAALALWGEIERHRKKGWRLMARFGPMLLARALTRSISFESALAAAGSRLGVRVAPMVLSAPEAAIDVDSLADLELAENILWSRRALQSNAAIRIVQS